MSRSLYRSPVTLMTLNQSQIKDLVTFLVTQRERLLLRPDVATRILHQKPLTRTPVSSVFAHAIDAGKEALLSLVQVPGTVADVPEVITYQHVTFDVRQFAVFDPALSRALEHTPFKDKLLLNVTPWLTRDGGVSDLVALHSTVVRDLLVRSYFAASGTWISPQITRYNARIYSMSLAALVAGVYNLTYAEQRVVAGIFAYYFLSQCLVAKDVEAFFRSSAKALNLDRAADIDLVLELMRAAGAPETLTLQQVVAALQQIGIERLRSLSVRVLHTKARSWGPDVYSSALALEYPPYFVWLLLLTASGRKTGLSFTLKKLHLDKELRVYDSQLSSAPGFLPLLTVR